MLPHCEKGSWTHPNIARFATTWANADADKTSDCDYKAALLLVQAALRGAQFHGGPFDENHGAYFPPVHETFLDEASSPFNFVV